jgi:hypothetical protein
MLSALPRCPTLGESVPQQTCTGVPSACSATQTQSCSAVFLCTCPKVAVSAARMKSHAMANSQPPPRAKPLTAAMIGLRTCGHEGEGVCLWLCVRWAGVCGSLWGGKQCRDDGVRTHGQ